MEKKITPVFCIMAAIEETTRAMGKDNKLLWHLPGDLPRFREFTTNQTIIMGRKTHESLGSKALPNRFNIVVSGNLIIREGDILVARSVKGAIRDSLALSTPKVFFIGGEKIFEEALQFVTELHLTLVCDPKKKADVYFPPYEHLFKEEYCSKKMEGDGISFSYATFVRI